MLEGAGQEAAHGSKLGLALEHVWPVDFGIDHFSEREPAQQRDLAL
jgi:hypothetical protein